MASTFKRRSKPQANHEDTPAASSLLGLSGTKAWTGGTTLTSTGVRDLDGILGGGQPLGTSVLIEEDRWTQSLASTLVRYWCAEAISQNQQLIIPTADEDSEGYGNPFAEEEEEQPATPTDGPSKAEVLKFLATLPFNLHWEKQQKKLQGASEMNASSTLMETLEEEEEEEDTNEEGLKIAWQYRKSVQQQRLGQDTATSTSKSSDVFCHSYDLSKQLSSQLDQLQKPPLEGLVTMDPVHCCDGPCPAKRSCGFRLYQKLLQQVQSSLKDHPRTVVRLLLYHRNPDTLSIALPLLLVQIRLLQLPVVVLVCLPPSNHSLLQLHRASDVVLQTEGFAARSLYPPPPEFRHLHGLLLVRKVSTHTAPTAIGGGHYADLTISKRPPANLYGVKRDRRKLHIPLLHIPPEDHSSAGGSGGMRSGAGTKPSTSGSSGTGCGTGKSLLEF